MPLLGFTVFKDKIVNGAKKQTIRLIRKYPIKKGDKLYLYWKLRRKDCEKLGESFCTESFFISMAYYEDPWHNGEDMFRIERHDSNGAFGFTDNMIEELAVRDGFLNAKEMMKFFHEKYPQFTKPSDINPYFQVIRWGDLQK